MYTTVVIMYMIIRTINCCDYVYIYIYIYICKALSDKRKRDGCPQLISIHVHLSSRIPYTLC